MTAKQHTIADIPPVGSQKTTDWADKLLLWSLCSLFFFIPTATTPAIITGILSVSIWLFSGKFIKDRRLWLNQPWTAPVIVFMLLPWIGLLWTEDIAMGLDFARKSYYWLYAFAIASLCLSRHSATALLSAFLVSLSLVSVFSLLQFSGLVSMPEWAPTIFRRSITNSLLLVFGILVASFYFLKADKATSKVFLFSLMLLFFSTIFVGTGRIGHLAFALLLPLIIYNCLGQKHFVKIAIVAVLAIGILSLSPSVQHRFEQAINDIVLYYQGYPHTSVGLRLHMWEGAVKIFLENPIIGAGTGGYQMTMEEHRHPNLPPDLQFSQPHNSFLYMAANFGIVGLVSFVWLLAVFLKKGWQDRNNIAGFAILSYGLVLIIGSFTDTQILSWSTGKLFALTMGLRTKYNDA
ncbi:O-antigen ligase family protein [Thermodesulfovibrionales bacterium]|nr:O-antigen ligase family protein [Thermodesulfovibrionales bacterium]